MLFGEQRMYAFAQLGGALAGLVFVRMAPRRGVSFMLSERWYGMRNRYYRWKRRRAARKFEVYMKRQGRTVKFDGQGQPSSTTIPTTKSAGTEKAGNRDWGIGKRKVNGCLTLRRFVLRSWTAQPAAR